MSGSGDEEQREERPTMAGDGTRTRQWLACYNLKLMSVSEYRLENNLTYLHDQSRIKKLLM